MDFFNYSTELVGFNEFPFWFDFASIHSSSGPVEVGGYGGQLSLPPTPVFKDP